MPRPSKGPRLALYKAKGRTTVWNIRDGQRTIGTGCLEGQRAEAERILAEYIIAKHDPRASRLDGDPNAIKIADALNVYMEDRAKDIARPKALIAMTVKLGEFFGERIIGDLTGTLQRDYAKQRGSLSAARRELETLAAAINYHIRDMVGGVKTLVPPGAARCLASPFAVADAGRSRRTDPRRMAPARGHHNGKPTGAIWPLHLKHLARFILVGLYTGTRAGAICGAALIPTIGRGYVNLRPANSAAGLRQARTNKRQPTVDLPPRLLAHMRRWHRLGISTKAVVEYRGEPITRQQQAWPKVVKAGLATDIPEQKVIPHTLRHTAISWYLRSGVPIDQVSDYCGVSIQIINKHYKHHIPGGFEASSRARVGMVEAAQQIRNRNRLQRT